MLCASLRPARLRRRLRLKPNDDLAGSERERDR